jgi:hypothetical protein
MVDTALSEVGCRQIAVIRLDPKQVLSAMIAGGWASPCDEAVLWGGELHRRPILSLGVRMRVSVSQYDRPTRAGSAPDFNHLGFPDSTKGFPAKPDYPGVPFLRRDWNVSIIHRDPGPL